MTKKTQKKLRAVASSVKKDVAAEVLSSPETARRAEARAETERQTAQVRLLCKRLNCAIDTAEDYLKRRPASRQALATDLARARHFLAQSTSVLKGLLFSSLSPKDQVDQKEGNLAARELPQLVSEQRRAR